jgi:hypothetical protein
MRPPSINLRSLLSKPAFGLTGWTCALLATFTAAHLYTSYQKTTDLSYYIKPIKIIVARAEHPSNLQTFYDGKEFKSPATAAEVVIWNRGDQTIHAAQILRPVILHTRDYAPILDIQIKANRSVTGLGLKDQNLTSGRATLQWRILEPGDGGIIRIIYAGGPDMDILADGAMEGQPRLHRLEPPEGTIYRQGFNRSLQRTITIGLWLFCAIIAFSIVFLFWCSTSAAFPFPMRIFMLLGAIALLISLIMLAYGLLNGYVEPPVGF